ncbi:sigma-54-dependent transcriptional regulator [Pseudomonas sp. CJQ_7]|jgi:two-component system C4-dicarboxylate transport response regulator DctD|uniref:HTH-type transcriptional regulatory protein TyrR n=1 Tax=Pseudomonas monteilii TaxID=76759 RepID=A0A2N1ILC4_9PSED|nr:MULTISPECIES: sigma-54 dependent transcriptional regulator [Pseudomonas]EKT4455880.1 sigma-54-dependent Fis family transcriptional regulator [Pseudomonas putida]EKT4495673.1 sigma-54-dependent Fis family transcriptional regulator [Pseudomonas putida]EKT4511555.1 sigma-54-dependent Fis family transcriptional regulator [Pseudomonas putida]EKT8865749.1 sigma-54-dependent Fis family transcriptional regulator [Pseudomonas putida]ERL01949.1 Fis family transcriptional regulator [Pseudomonas putida
MTTETLIDSRAQVILVDDDPHLRQALSQTLDLAGLKVVALAEAQGLAERIEADWPGVVVSDIRMPGIDGLQLLEQLHSRDSELPVLLITGHGDVPLAVQAMRAGAYDFLEKPFATDALLDSVRRALALRRLVLDNRSLRLALSDRQQLATRLVGHSPAMLRLREQIAALAGTRADVLILGETGAGKEVVARALHDLSSRSEGPFVAINAGALAESVVESELFGHEPGAFTGAQKRRIGKFEFANGGTLFLDEIESMSLDVQVKLLRMLQERVVERLGGNQLIPLDIRIIAATKEDLRQSADQGRFRADLYYRLNVAPLRIPPLRERGDDILVLFQHFADAASQRHGLSPHALQPTQRALLLRHDWPGNVRELQNAAERFALGLELALDGQAPSAAAPTAPKLSGNLSEQVEQFERSLIAAELAQPHSSMRSLAEALGIPRKTLHDKLRKHGLNFDGGSGGHDDQEDNR